MNEKRCTACKRFKPTSEFYRNRSKADGYASCCKTCSNAPAIESDQAHPFNASALPSWRGFLNAYGRRALSKRRRSHQMIVSVPVAQREQLEAFCRALELPVTAIYPLPRVNSAEDRFGVVLHNCALLADGQVLLYPGCISKAQAAA